ncbi:MAG: AGE family epimerase/isomerase [Bacteroidota bacterium]
MKPSLLFCLLFLFLSSCNDNLSNTNRTPKPDYVSQFDSVLQSLLNCWFPIIIDTTAGGYFCNFEYNWEKSEEQPKHLLHHARGLWTASKAATFYPENPIYKQTADHGYNYLISHFWDTSNQGFFSSLTHTQQFSYKNTYDNAFAIFALSEYAKINPDLVIKDWLKKSFDWFELHAHDKTHSGYFHFIIKKEDREAFLNSSQYKANNYWGNIDWKNQNTSIHIMEAFANMYLVMPSEQLRKRLEEIFLLIRDNMVSENGHLNLYFYPDWTPISHLDSSKNFILENKQFDHISFGHDIETAYLLLETAETLYGKPDSITQHIAKKLTDHSLKYGLDRDYYGMFYEGYRFKGSDSVSILNNQKAWWVQAEAWHTLALMKTLYPDEKLYSEAYPQLWKYINEQLLDKEYGGWYNNGLDTRPQTKLVKKGHPWKSAYHNGRALMQVLQYKKSE